jgi:hypothetical protein
LDDENRLAAPTFALPQDPTMRQETTMVAKTDEKLPLYKRAGHEFVELAILTLYLYVTIGAVIMMKTAVLHTHGVDFAPWGVAIVKAVLLAKFMLIGHAMKIGERNTTSPLIWPTLHKAVAFLVLLIILTVAEETIVGLFHHQSIATSLGDLFGARLDQTGAGIFMLLLIPYFAFRVLDDALGEGKLIRMFFVDRNLNYIAERKS